MTSEPLRIAPVTVPISLSESAVKREMYALDPYFREAFEDFQSQATHQSVLNSTCGLLMKPEAIANRKVEAILSWLAENSFSLKEIDVVTLNRHVARELWRYQANAYTRERLDFIDAWCNASPCIYVLLADSLASSSISGCARLTSLKGHANPAHQHRGELRHALNQSCTLLNFVHTTDEPADLLRDIGILFPFQRRRGIFASLATAPTSSSNAGHEKIAKTVGGAYESVAYHDLDIAQCIARVRVAAEGAEQVTRRVLIAGCDHWNDESMDRQFFFQALMRTTVDMLPWDLVVLRAHLIAPATAGFRAIIPSALQTMLDDHVRPREDSSNRERCLLEATTSAPPAPTPPVAEMSDEDPLEGKHVFWIVGMSKSGTTWVQHALDGHPAIVCKGEGHFPNVLMPALQNAWERYNESSRWRNKSNSLFHCPELDDTSLERILKSVIKVCWSNWMRPHRPTTTTHLGEKTPENARHLPLLAEKLFPESKVVHIIRDGRDAAVSGWLERLRTRPLETLARYGNQSNYARTFAYYWVDSIRSARDFGRRHPTRYCEIRYEHLVHDEHKGFHKVLAFLGVNDSESQVSQVCRHGSFSRLTGGRQRGTEDKNSFFRQGVPGSWRKDLSAESIHSFNEQGGTLLAELGYDLP
jgi:nucleoside diphosphate kinase